MSNLAGVLTVLSILSDMYMSSRENKAKDEAAKEEREYQEKVEQMEKERSQDQFTKAKRNALGRAIGSDVSLNAPVEPLEYPRSPDPYKTPDWIQSGRGVNSALRFIGSSGAAEGIEGGMGNYRNRRLGELPGRNSSYPGTRTNYSDNGYA